MTKSARARLGLVLLVLVTALGAVTLVDDPPSAAAAKCPPSKPGCGAPPPAWDGRCVVWLHGRGGSGSATVMSGGVKYLYPQGNTTAPEGGYQWRYFDSDGSYGAASSAVRSAIQGAGCTRAVVDGFSNGGGFAGKLFCRGETFGIDVRGYVVDDPVTDHGADGCAGETNVVMYWTGALADVRVDSCEANGWICDGDTLVGPDQYAQNLGLGYGGWTQSKHRRHKPYLWPPEVAAWLG